MSDSTPNPERSAGLSPLEVPFIGWSCAAHEFRAKAAELAPKGILPLLVGDPGVGRRCMARAWLHVAGLGEDIPIVDLDREPAELPRRCIGYTTRRPARGRQYHILGQGLCWNARKGSPGGPTLPDPLVQLFGVVLYMPPIHRAREIDILAYLDYCNKVRFPRAGFRYSEISAPLLNRLFFDDEWPANFRGLSTYLEAVAELDRRAAAPHGPDGEVRVLPVLCEHRELRLLTPPLSRDPDARIVDWICHADEAPFEILPDLAVRIFHWQCRHGPAGHEDSEPLDSELRRMLLPEPAWERTSGLKACDFLRLSAREYVEQFLFLGLKIRSPEQKAFYPAMIDCVTKEPHFGTTFDALKGGLQIDPASVGEVAVIPVGGRGSPMAPAPDRNLDGNGGRQPNRFTIKGKYFMIEFHSPEGTENDQFLCSQYTGLYYYRALIANPRRPLHPEDLYDEVAMKKFKSKQVRLVQGEEARSLANQTVSLNNYEPSTDPESLKEYWNQIHELVEEIKEEEALGDEETVKKLKHERNSILKHVKEMTHGNKPKNSNKQTKKCQDNVRNAMKCARERLAESMPRLARHLEESVKPSTSPLIYNPHEEGLLWET